MNAFNPTLPTFFRSFMLAMPSAIVRKMIGEITMRTSAMNVSPSGRIARAPRVFRLAFRFTGDDELARELTQETFIRAFAQLGRFRGDSALSTWLHRVTISVVSNAMRKVKRFRTRETDLDEAASLTVEGEGADPDMRDRLYRAIDELAEIYRITLVMHDVEGY